MTTPSSVSDLREQVLRQINAQAATAHGLRDGVLGTGEGPTQPSVPMEGSSDEWSGDVLDVSKLHIPFDSHQIDEDFRKATSDPRQPGTTSDLAVCNVQGDWLALSERTFRARHSTRVRTYLQAASTLNGIGHDFGPLKRGVLNHITNLLRRGRRGV